MLGRKINQPGDSQKVKFQTEIWIKDYQVMKLLHYCHLYNWWGEIPTTFYIRSTSDID